MGKISKPVLKKHMEALEILKKDKLNYWDKEFVFNYYHEGATNMNNLVSAHFTPLTLATAIAQNTRDKNFVDLCAGIGVLSWAMVRDHELGRNPEKPFMGICVENIAEFYNIGKKLVPECHWINGDILDLEVIKEIQSLMGNRSFSIISNPPYGSQVKSSNKELLHYKGAEFEYKVIELGAILGANAGTFLIGQESCPFKFTRVARNVFLTGDELPQKYRKFVEQTGLEITPNNGWHTDIGEDHEGWKDVNITTEIAIVDYDELEYKPKQITKQESLF